MKKIKKCPFCYYTSFIKYGKYNKIQRYKCKNPSCSKTFSDSTNSIWYNSKKSTTQWYKYCELMFSGKTIRECASKLNISIDTSFKWRHKILNKLPICNSKLYLDSYIGFKHIHFFESFKGKRNLSKSINSRKKIFVSICVNEKKSSFSQIVSKQLLNQNSSYLLLKNKLNFNSQVIGFLDRYAIAIAKNLNKNLMKIQKCTKSKENKLREISNSFHITLKKWIGLFRGVATKYLNSYLDWFIHIFENTFSNKILVSNLINAIFSS